MTYKYEAPSQDQIADYMNLAAKRTPATRVLSVADIEFGITHETGWSNADAFATMIVDLGNTPVTGAPLWLREGEVFLHTFGRLPQRHCAWGRYSSGGEMCMKPVVKVQLTWGLECCGGPKDHNYVYNQAYSIDSWRHMDGTPLHQRDNETWNPDCGACDPIGLCLGCGQERTDNHCSTCHTNGSLVTEMQAWGNTTTCKTEGCDYHSYYCIGD